MLHFAIFLQLCNICTGHMCTYIPHYARKTVQSYKSRNTSANCFIANIAGLLTLYASRDSVECCSKTPCGEALKSQSQRAVMQAEMHAIA